MLRLIEDLGMLYPKETSKRKQHYAIFKCKCGNEFRAIMQDVKHKKTQSCGCYAIKIKREVNTKHGLKNHRLFRTWQNIKRRCTNIKTKDYHYYGGRGISIYNEWKSNFKAFYNWAMANGYQDSLTIDRIDVNGNYEPSNCRWVDRTIQAINQRNLRTCNTSGYNGVNFDKKDNKWVARISVNKKRKLLGRFKCRLQAAYAREDYIIKNNLEHTRNFN